MEFGGKYKVRERGLFDPSSKEPHRLSRTKIEFYIECPRCFYLDQRHGVGRPETPSFTLNNAIDELFKREFDVHRAAGTQHPLTKAYGLAATPMAHKDLELWRDALRHGIQYVHKPTNLLIRGGIDDVWITDAGEVVVVDYKATSKRKEVELYEAYKRQAEVYQWLFEKNGFTVYPEAIFVYANGNSDADAFNGKLEFSIQLIPHKGNTAWIEPLLLEIKKSLTGDSAPARGSRCDYCPYREAAGLCLAEVASTTQAGKVLNKKPTTGELF